MPTTRSSYAQRRAVADALRNRLRGINVLAQSGVVQVLANLPGGRKGSIVDVPMDVALARFKSRSEAASIAASDLGDTFQSMTIEQASMGFTISRGAGLASDNDPWVKADENVAVALPALIEDRAAAAAAASATAVALTATPTAIVTEDQLDELLYAFGDESQEGTLILGHSAHHKGVVKMKDTTGARIFRPAVQNGPVLVHGKPIIGSDAVPQYYEASNRSFVTGGGTTVTGDLTTSGSLSRHVKKTLYVKITGAGLGPAATFAWALAKDGETPTYSAPAAVAASVALGGTDIVLAFNVARTYSVNDIWTFLPSADLMFLRPKSVLFTFDDNLSILEQINASVDTMDMWAHVYFAVAALDRIDMSDMSGIAKVRTKL